MFLYLCMYVCMYASMYVYVCMYVCMHACMRLFMHLCIDYEPRYQRSRDPGNQGIRKLGNYHPHDDALIGACDVGTADGHLGGGKSRE
jgi:hypothetical protein